ncbi:MAG: phosphoribosylformylglycinamidine synthase subunit PurS [Candidatus Nitrospinota bacterium M3_3B_026]
MKASVRITLKKGILDPQGKAVKEALTAINGQGVKDVRIGKLVEIEIDEDDAEKAKKAIKRMCEKLLANPVTENYRIELIGE